MSTPQRYLDRVRTVIDHLATSQSDAVEAAANAVVAALRNGGTVSCSEVGHGIQHDFMNRAGGLLALQPFSYHISINNPQPECRRRQGQPAAETELARIRFAVETSNLKAGDVMVVSSVSGRNCNPVELALACRDKGLTVIGLTSLAYTAKVTSLHPSGKRLCDAVDIVIDCGAPYGDAAVEIDGYSHALIPVSGAGMLMAGWMVWGLVMERMAADGPAASVFMSHNRDGGPEANDKSRARYNKEGY